MFSKVFSAQTNLLNAHIIDIEIDITKKTLYKFSVVGLPDKAVEESRDRVSDRQLKIQGLNLQSQKIKRRLLLLPLPI